jgi:integrase/recombinase XerD
MHVQTVELDGGRRTWTVVDASGLAVEPIEAFLEHLRLGGRSPNTVRAYAKGLQLWWAFLLAAELEWGAVGVADVGAFLSWLRCPPSPSVHCGADSVAESTVALRLAAVVSFYGFHEAFSGVPVARSLTRTAGRFAAPYRGVLGHLDRHREQRRPVVRVRRTARRTPVFTPGQISAILEDCARRDGHEWVGSLRDRLLFETLAETGMRLGECLALQHRDWHLGRGGVPFIDVVARDDHPAGLRVKHQRPRRVHVSDPLERLYGEYVWELCDAGIDVVAAGLDRSAGGEGRLEDWFVFVNLHRGVAGRPLMPSTVYDKVATIKRHLGSLTPADWTPHWFRHSHASALLLAGAPPLYVARRLGHADVTTTLNLYGWVTEDAELQAVDWRRLAGWKGDDDG